MPDPPPLLTTTPLDYAAPEPSKRRRRLILWLALLTTAAHLLLTLLFWWGVTDGRIFFVRFMDLMDLMMMPLIFVANAGWLDQVPRAVVLYILLPLNSLLYGLLLTALALLIARSARLLRITATLFLAYPLLFAACLYGQWLTAWFVLGHPPRPSLDDPSHVPISNHLYLATGLAMLAIPFAACLAISLNLAHILFHHPTRRHIIFRLALLLTLWSALAVIFTLDPGHVLYWWFD